MMENPDSSSESGPPQASESLRDLTRAEEEDQSDSRTESAEDGPDHWRETEENDADDEEEEEEEDDDDDDDDEDDREKAVQAFTPNVMIVQPAGRADEQKLEIQMEKIVHTHTHTPQLFLPAWIDRIDRPEGGVCVEVVRLCVCVAAAALMFPLLVWAGFKLLPFEAPPLASPALRLLYTLRCGFFASLPIVLGVLVQGVSRLRFGPLKPLFDGSWQNREVCVHGLFVRDSVQLYLLYFLQLAVMATYAQQEMLKLVPLLTIIFVFGRLIYWACVAFGSSVRALGFSLSFLPLLVLLGANLYFIGSVGGQEAVFDVAPPTTAPSPKLRWWG